MKRWVLLSLIALAPSVLSAQVIPVRPVPRPPGDTLHPDSTKKDTALVKWNPADTTMQRLLRKPGYTPTRFQGTTFTLDALTSAVDLAAQLGQKAVVQRGDQLAATDSTIHYQNQQIRLTTKTDSSFGGCTIQPGRGQAPIRQGTTCTYDMDERSGRITGARFTVDNRGGAQWFVHPDVVKAELGDSARGIESRFYASDATFTSCDDSISPDYYFELHEMKRTKNTIVGRPAVLVIGGVPVMWLPFFVQDLRSGRKSGILTPRFGVTDIVRNSPTYKRDIENVGYFWALNDYMDAQLWLDWRSGTGGTGFGDPGWLRYSGEWRYRWRDRFLQGQIATSYTEQNDRQTNLAVNWTHTEEFSRNSRLNANINYVTSTQIQRQNTFNPYAALATISSSLAYQQKVGPAQISIGGTRKQYPGRDQIDQTFPTLSIISTPINIGSEFIWTPSFNYSASQSLKIDQPGLFSEHYFTNAVGAIDSSVVKRSSYQSTLSFDTPIQLFGFKLRNAFRVSDQQNIFPQQYVVFPNPSDTSNKQTRVFASTFHTDVDWIPGFDLPSLGHNALNLTPSVSLSNVDPSAYMVRSERTGGQFVTQSKRLVYSLSAAPTVYGLFPGLGPFAGFRHAFTPTFGYTYAPAAAVSDAFLAATGRTRPGYLGSLKQNAVNFGLTQNIQGKLRTNEDPTTGGPAPQPGRKITLLSLNFSPLTYDFERAKQTKRPINGLTTETFNYSLSSDLLPGFSFSMGYSLFQGSTLSDTARFSPYRNSIAASFNVSQQQNPFGFILRMLGASGDSAKVPPAAAATGASGMTGEQQMARQLASQPVAGSASRQAMYLPPVSKTWSASFTLSANRQRPPIGGTIINADPKRFCEQYRLPTSPAYNPAAYDLCIQQQSTAPTLDSPIPNTSAGGPVYLNPPTASLGSNINFPLTEKWSASWQTTYDFVNRQFASHIVTLQRDLHDWTANFSFTQSPNGNFAFSFFIALKADADLKFNYNRATYRGVGAP